jgi:hypothetical protein
VTDASSAGPIQWAFRRQTFAASEALLRILHAAVLNYGSDVESFIVYLAITCACVGGAIRNPDLAVRPPPVGPMPQDWYRPVSRRAIAASTGLPRETVRRKVQQFLEAGLLERDGMGVRIPRRLLEDTRNRDFARTMIREFGRAAEELERIA